MIGKNTGLRPLLLAAAAVQFIICLTAIGTYHPDQYFQIIEFSSWQLNKASAAGHVWEFSAHLRSTLQIYLFSAWREVCSALFIRDPYLQLTLLRVAFGMTLFVFFNWMTWYYLQHQPRRVLNYALLILNFSWILPYTRTLFSSIKMTGQCAAQDIMDQGAFARSTDTGHTGKQAQGKSGCNIFQILS